MYTAVSRSSLTQVWVAVLLVAVGCGGKHSGARDDGGVTVDLGGGVDLPANPAFGALMPSVVKLSDNAIIAHPKVVAITYDNDPHRAEIEQFFGELKSSAAWSAMTSEYGVGAIAAVAAQHLGNAPASLDDAAVQALLVEKLGGATPAWGPADPSTVYMLFVPIGTELDDGTGSLCCQDDYDGYHAEVIVGSKDIAYALVCACPEIDGPSVTGANQLTIAASHELVESVTDPFYDPAGWGETDDAHAIWTYVSEGETADMCQEADTAFYQPPDMTFMIQRVWSNRAAALGHDPCVPDAPGPYYQTIPEQNDAATITLAGADPWETKGFHIALGATANVPMTVFAVGTNGPFTVTVEDYASAWLGNPAALAIESPTQMVMAGDTLSVPVKVLSTVGDLAGGEAFVVTTTPVAGGPSTYFYALISQ